MQKRSKYEFSCSLRLRGGTNGTEPQTRRVLNYRHKVPSPEYLGHIRGNGANGVFNGTEGVLRSWVFAPWSLLDFPGRKALISPKG